MNCLLQLILALTYIWYRFLLILDVIVHLSHWLIILIQFLIYLRNILCRFEIFGHVHLLITHLALLMILFCKQVQDVILLLFNRVWGTRPRKSIPAFLFLISKLFDWLCWWWHSIILFSCIWSWIYLLFKIVYLVSLESFIVIVWLRRCHHWSVVSLNLYWIVICLLSLGYSFLHDLFLR